MTVKMCLNLGIADLSAILAGLGSSYEHTCWIVCRSVFKDKLNVLGNLLVRWHWSDCSIVVARLYPCVDSTKIQWPVDEIVVVGNTQLHRINRITKVYATLFLHQRLDQLRAFP